MFALFNCVEVLIIAKDKNEALINDQIRVSELMVIGPNGEQMGVKRLQDALTLANYAGLDLVLMSGNSVPAVGKIMDYNRLRKIDFDVLKQELSTVVIDDKQERYQMKILMKNL